MSNLIRKLFHYGHNVHDCGHSVGYGHVDRRGDGIARVYCGNPAGFVRSSSLGFRDIRNPLAAPQGTTARLSSFLQLNRLPLVAVTGLVIGLFLFAKPVFASVGVGDGSHYYSESPDVTLNVTDIADECTHGTYPNEDESRFGLEFWANSTEMYDTGYIGLGTGYCVNCDFGYRFSYPSIYAYFTDLAIPDGTYDTVKVYCYDDYHASTVNSGNPVESNSYLIVIDSTTSTVSTLEQQMSDYMGSVSWSEEYTEIPSSTHFVETFDWLADDATSTFPICYISPFFSLLDTFYAATTQGLDVQGFDVIVMGSNTTTLTLTGVSSTWNDIGAIEILELISGVTQALMWVLLGLWVLNRAFFNQSDIDAD